MIYPFQKQIPFEYEDYEDNSYIDESYKTLGPLHSALCTGVEFTSKNQFPIVEPNTGNIPEVLCSVHRLRKKPDSLLRGICGHFFTPDSNIEPYWTHPFKYLQWLKKLGYVTSTDFSLYSNMVLIQKLWNSFRNKISISYPLHHGAIWRILNYIWKAGQRIV